MLPLQENETQSISQNYNFRVGVRKEFGILIPFLKKRFTDVEFVTFLDINGNGEKDSGKVIGTYKLNEIQKDI